MVADHDSDDQPGRANILIVDDRPDKLLVYQSILEDPRQVLYTATSGEEALRKTLERDYALILLDVNMPGMDGLETAALIRNRRKSSRIPIIFATADYSDEFRTAAGYALGAVDYITSPVVPEILRAKVKVFVDFYLLAQQAERQARENIALAEERAARAAAEHASRRLAFLADASAALSRSLVFAQTVRELAELSVPFLADVVALTLLDEYGGHRVTELAWMETHSAEKLVGKAVSDLRDLPFGGDVELSLASDTIAPVMLSGLRDLAAGERATPPGMPAIDSLIIAPLHARGRMLGVLSLGLGPSGRQFDDDVLSTAGELAGRAAIALDNALLYEKIREDDRRKNEFLAMLAHELRNPLAPINNAVHVLRASEHDATRLGWARDVIGRQVTQLVRLVDDLLDLSRITRGKIDLRIDVLDAGEVVAAAVETSRPGIDALGHALTVSLPPYPLQLHGDFTRVAQILGNLLNNAAKYSLPGGQIALSAVRDGNDVVFRVRDAGMGIPAEALNTIFEPFTQVDHTLSRAQGGLGIGLTLVRRLVEMQGGSVVAASPGRNLGSEFTVRLPAAEDTPVIVGRPPAVADAGDGHSLSGLRILIVDDNKDVAESTALFLRMSGGDVHVAFDGREALNRITQLRPDAVLLDIGMPGMDGYRVAEQIRSRNEHDGMFLIAVSGFGIDRNRVAGKASAFDRYVVKPFDPLTLTTMLCELRDRAAATAGTAGNGNGEP
jgi:signal transduction histidine kinase/DNA-binding response OmpR family regulator